MTKKVDIDKSWYEVLNGEFDKPYFFKIREFVRMEYKNKVIFPEPKDIFNAFNSTSFNQVKVVIVGQDPYHGDGQAHGLSFSVNKGVDIPPSLKNIFKEIEDDLGLVPKNSGNLQHWADQGVLLINTVLTVEKGKPHSHKGIGWEEFTNTAIKKLSEKRHGLVFLLWGNSAQEKEKLIDLDRHLVLKSVHPSPLSAYNGFFGCKHFSQTNNYLDSINKSPIEWGVGDIK
tara:strand:+ start:5682 stop:6368 length:687 start_codon:yes stop_codon:yes gene_type:complete